MGVKSRSKSARLTFPRPAYSAPTPHESVGEEIRRLMLPATKALPFVKLRAHDQPWWRPESFWHVVRTGRREMDVQLGRYFARSAIAAMTADQNSDLIALILEDIVRHGIERTGKKGRRRLSPTAWGFLMEISEALAASH